MMVPVSVAGLGTREAALLLLMAPYAISQEQALGFSLTVFGLMVVFALAGGLLEGWDLLHRTQRSRPGPRRLAEGNASETSGSSEDGGLLGPAAEAGASAGSPESKGGVGSRRDDAKQ
jgi:hypothetical protein